MTQKGKKTKRTPKSIAVPERAYHFLGERTSYVPWVLPQDGRGGEDRVVLGTYAITGVQLMP